MVMNPANEIFDSQTLADDLGEVRRIYADFFAKLDGVDWDKPHFNGRLFKKGKGVCHATATHYHEEKQFSES
jgi:hypothetical protein